MHKDWLCIQKGLRAIVTHGLVVLRALVTRTHYTFDSLAATVVAKGRLHGIKSRLHGIPATQGHTLYAPHTAYTLLAKCLSGHHTATHTQSLNTMAHPSGTSSSVGVNLPLWDRLQTHLSGGGTPSPLGQLQNFVFL